MSKDKQTQAKPLSYYQDYHNFAPMSSVGEGSSTYTDTKSLMEGEKRAESEALAISDCDCNGIITVDTTRVSQPPEIILDLENKQADKTLFKPFIHSQEPIENPKRTWKQKL